MSRPSKKGGAGANKGASAAPPSRASDLEAALRRLRAALDAKDKAIAVLAHDVRGPLNILAGHAKLLAGGGLPKQESASVEAILRQSKKLLELSQALLEESAGEEPRARLAPVELDLAQLSREVCGESEILGAERGVSVCVAAPDKLLVRADRAKLRRLLQSLLGHAVARAREGGEVRVELGAGPVPFGEQARVAICDDGAPPAAAELPVLFERFHGGGGTVHLASCRELVELHGGQIWAEPRGKGCAFVFTLPAAPAGSSAAEARPRVLVVEDDPDIAEIAAEILSERYRVELAGDGAEAIEKARALTPDVVLMDVFLPGMDGLDAAAALKAARETRAIPIIFVSAHHGLADKVRALELGAVDYLPKPFDAGTLLSRVQAALDSRVPRGEGAVLRTDPSTGLLDRPSFLRRVAQESLRAKRYGRPMSLVGFAPEVPVADAALGSAAAALRAALRGGDLVCSLGGGRFAVCLLEAGAPAAKSVSGRLAEALTGSCGVKMRTGIVDGLAGTLEEQLELALRGA